MKKLNLLILFLLLITTGCASNEQYSAKKMENRNDQRINTLQQGNQVNEIRGRTMSDQNPNLVNINGRSYDRGDDVDHARSVINRMEGFRPGAIWINGSGMWVTAYKKGMMTNDEKIDAEASLHERLTRALPRYRIEVRVLEDRS
ncbi:hypothetical protein [Neobacillus sp. LXY-4]|uniref:hypothetical protein n=1 Tax=Neobacillus sp. LXY-4 TaxID=3379826 RepID=UPI003EDFD627